MRARPADYDALALSAFAGAPEELDVTVLQVRCGGCAWRGRPWPASGMARAHARAPPTRSLTQTACVPLQVGSEQEAAASAGAAKLVAACHDARQFTDIANFALRCGVCQIGLKGEREAAEHAKATGHTRFTEY